MDKLNPLVYHMREFKQSQSWTVLCEELERMTQDMIGRMLSEEKDKFDYYKGQIEAMRMLIRLPDILITKWSS